MLVLPILLATAAEINRALINYKTIIGLRHNYLSCTATE